jgi:quercetin dioxygenase-like cupin family protein
LAVCAVAFAAQDEKGFVWLAPGELNYQPNPSGPDIAVVAGDPTKEGFYVIRARFAPGVMSRPHYHPTDRHVTVISGTWWAGRGPNFDPNSTIPLGPGSYMLHPAGEVHYDGAKDVEAIVEIKGIGPAPTVPAAQQR